MKDLSKLTKKELIDEFDQYKVMVKGHNERRDLIINELENQLKKFSGVKSMEPEILQQKGENRALRSIINELHTKILNRVGDQ